MTFLRNSTVLQLQCKIFTAGLIENPSVSCDFALRRGAYEEHAHKWSNAGRVVKRVQELPLGLFSKPHSITALGGGLLASHEPDTNCLAFARIPSVVSRKPIEWWSIPPFPFTISGFAAHVPDNVLVVGEIKMMER